jgi:hypothetical protein
MAVPHASQNFRPASFSVPQFEQIIGPFRAVAVGEAYQVKGAVVSVRR